MSKNQKMKKGEKNIFGLIREETITEKGKKVTKHKKRDSYFNTGRWQTNEHKKFIDALLKYGNDWKNVQGYLGTRSSTQARSHAQKFFYKIGRIEIENLNLDFENNSLKSLNLMASRLSREQLTRAIIKLNDIAFDKKFNGKKFSKKIEKEFQEESSKTLPESEIIKVLGKRKLRTKRRRILNIKNKIKLDFSIAFEQSQDFTESTMISPNITTQFYQLKHLNIIDSVDNQFPLPILEDYPIFTTSQTHRKSFTFESEFNKSFNFNFLAKEKLFGGSLYGEEKDEYGHFFLDTKSDFSPCNNSQNPADVNFDIEQFLNY